LICLVFARAPYIQDLALCSRKALKPNDETDHLATPLALD